MSTTGSNGTNKGGGNGILDAVLPSAADGRFSDRELAVMSAIASRAALASQLGKSFNGKRDYYESLGYPRNLRDEQLYAKYTRDPLARRMVNLVAGRTWQDMPQVASDTAAQVDIFSAAVTELADRFSWLDYCRRTDRLSSMGRYALLFIGTAGDGDLAEPQEPLRSADDILYLAPFHSTHVTELEFGADPRQPRYRLPERYRIRLDATMDADGTMAAERWVHHSRVIHVAQDTLVDDVYGTPLLETLYNDLEDALKVRGASAEAIWRLVYQGITIEARDGASIADTAEEIREKAEQYLHGLTRVLVGQDIDYSLHGGSTIDPSGMWRLLRETLSAGSDIPSRILFGTERGELASSQDEANFAATIGYRRNTFAEPRLLRPLIDWHIKYGVLSAPGGYTVTWQPAFELNEKEIAELAKIRAETMQILSRVSMRGLTAEIATGLGFSEAMAAALMPGGETGVEQ